MDFKLQLFFTDNQRGGFSESYYAQANDPVDMQIRATNLINRRKGFLDDTYMIEEGRISVIVSGVLNTRETQLVTSGLPVAGADDGSPDIKDRKGSPTVALLLRIESGLSYRGRMFIRGLKPARYDGELWLPGPIAGDMLLWAGALSSDFMLRVNHRVSGTYLLVPVTKVFASRIVSHRIGRSVLTPRGRRGRRR